MSVDFNSSSVEITSDSSFDNPDLSTDFLYSDSDSHAQNTSSNRKKPRCAKKATKRKNKVVKTPKALHSSMGIDWGLSMVCYTNLCFLLQIAYRPASMPTDLSEVKELNSESGIVQEDSNISSISRTGKYIYLLTIKIIVSMH